MVIVNLPRAVIRLCIYRRAPFARQFSSTVKFSVPLETKLKAINDRYIEVGRKLSDSTIGNQLLMTLGKEYSELTTIVGLIQQRDALIASANDLAGLAKEANMSNKEDKELAELAESERLELLEKKATVESDIIEHLTPKDVSDQKNIVLEVRAGTGGDEASLFAGEVFKMYAKYAVLQGWRWEELTLSKTEIGGFKEAQASIVGEDVYKFLKFESGTHRVQRVPVNDVKIQTSAAMVLVLPEVAELECEIRAQDLKIDVYRSSGAGGQSVNKTESAVRITHLPTGLSVAMQDERSQIQNRAKAMKVIRARVHDFQSRQAQATQSQLRSETAGTGSRSDKVRTFNFPQDRVTDHRVGLTISGVDRVLSGVDLQTIVEALVADEKKQRLENFVASLV
jgi:peptide chain release factor 1